MGLLIPLLASQRELKSQLSRLYMDRGIFNHSNLMPDHYTDLFILLIFRGRAKPGKKAKLNKLVDDVNPSELEQQQPELSHPVAEDIIDDPPSQDHEVSTDRMDTEPAISKPPSPVKPLEEKTDDVVITGSPHCLF